jgi:hypothetical protein
LPECRIGSADRATPGSSGIWEDDTVVPTSGSAGGEGLPMHLVRHWHPLLHGLFISFHVLSISFSFERLSYQQFWQSLGNAIQPADRTQDISSQQDFFRAFASGSQERPVVLLIDELSKLHSAPDDIRNTFLEALREIRNHNVAYVIDSVIATGTFSIVSLSTTDTSLSPFNVSNSIQNPYFTFEETRTLFQMFMEDNNIDIEDTVIEDVWAKSNGYITQLNSLPP